MYRTKINFLNLKSGYYLDNLIARICQLSAHPESYENGLGYMNVMANAETQNLHYMDAVEMLLNELKLYEGKPIEFLYGYMSLECATKCSNTFDGNLSNYNNRTELIYRKAWVGLIGELKRIAGYRCVCGVSHLQTHLEPHHMYYGNNNYEEVDSISMLCRNCHQNWHNNFYTSSSY